MRKMNKMSDISNRKLPQTETKKKKKLNWKGKDRQFKTLNRNRSESRIIKLINNYIIRRKQSARKDAKLSSSARKLLRTENAVFPSRHGEKRTTTSNKQPPPFSATLVTRPTKIKRETRRLYRVHYRAETYSGDVFIAQLARQLNSN